MSLQLLVTVLRAQCWQCAGCALLTLEVQVGTVSIGVALSVVLQAAVQGELHHRAVQPITNVVVLTFTLTFFLLRERRKKAKLNI